MLLLIFLIRLDIAAGRLDVELFSQAGRNKVELFCLLLLVVIIIVIITIILPLALNSASGRESSFFIIFGILFVVNTIPGGSIVGVHGSCLLARQGKDMENNRAVKKSGKNPRCSLALGAPN